MRLTKAFKGCRAGEVHPTQFQPGDECPKELEHAAEELGILETAAQFEKRQKAERAEEHKRLKAERAAEQERLEAEEAKAEQRLAALKQAAEAGNVDISAATTAEEIETLLTAAGVALPQA